MTKWILLFSFGIFANCAFSSLIHTRAYQARDSHLFRQEKAAAISKYMNFSADPCEDFYEFSCGNWARYHAATNENRITSSLDELKKKVNEEVKTILEEPFKVNEKRIHRLTKDFYQSCMDTQSIKRHGNEPILKFINDNGGMPALVHRWDERKFNWLKLISSLKFMYGMDILIGLEIMRDLKNPLENRVYLGGPKEFPLVTRNMYIDAATKRYRDRYRARISNNLQAKLNLSEQEAHRLAEEILYFEIQLAKGMEDSKASVDFARHFTPISLFNLNVKYDSIDFQYYVSTSLGLPVNSYLSVYEVNSEYFENLEKVIASTSKRSLANYIMWSAVNYLEFSDETHVNRRTDLCIKKTTAHFSKIVGSMYYRRYFKEEKKLDVEHLGRLLKDSFVEELKNLAWLDDATKAVAIYKLSAMRLELVSHDEDELEKEYLEPTLHINRGEFIKNILSVMSFDQNQERKKLYESPRTATARDFEASSVNAAYLVMENVIKIPLGILQEPYYNTHYPNSIKFGQIGYVIAHEMVHGFDDVGRYFDQYGNRHDWWDGNSTEYFRNTSKCFANQYHEYRFGNRKLPVSESQTENIADNVGIKIAFKAYLQWLKNTRDREILLKETLPIDLTNTQLAFVSFAQTWCQSIIDEAKLIVMMIDDHVPGKIRVNGALANFDEFSKEFRCPPGSGMHAAERCVLY